jgi:hypothetical protein
MISIFLPDKLKVKQYQHKVEQDRRKAEQEMKALASTAPAPLAEPQEPTPTTQP